MTINGSIKLQIEEGDKITIEFGNDSCITIGGYTDGVRVETYTGFEDEKAFLPPEAQINKITESAAIYCVRKPANITTRALDAQLSQSKGTR